MNQKKNSNRLSIATAAVGAAIVLAGCATEPAETPADEPSAAENEIFEMLPDFVKEAGVITSGALLQTPPVIGASDDDPNLAVGIVPDLAELLEPILGVEIEFINTQWPNQLPGVQSGALDTLWGQVSVTDEREQSIVDLIPWQTSPSGLLIAAGNPLGIDSVASMCGMRVAVPNGSTQMTDIQEVSDAECADTPIEILQYQGGADAVAAVRAGTVDAWMDSLASQNDLVEADPDVFDVVAVPESEIEPTFSGIAIGKANPELTEALLAAFTIIVEDGSYEAVLDEYDMGYAAITLDQLVPNPYTGTPVGEIVTP